MYASKQVLKQLHRELQQFILVQYGWYTLRQKASLGVARLEGNKYSMTNASLILPLSYNVKD
jgi:hypothetical protein